MDLYAALMGGMAEQPALTLREPADVSAGGAWSVPADERSAACSALHRLVVRFIPEMMVQNVQQ
jgi:hypothetical protein